MHPLHSVSQAAQATQAISAIFLPRIRFDNESFKSHLTLLGIEYDHTNTSHNELDSILNSILGRHTQYQVSSIYPVPGQSGVAIATLE
jgi:hypothetical protein